MTNATNLGGSKLGTDGYHLPVRVQFASVREPGTIVIAGTPGAYGDAGWSTVECSSRVALERFAADHPQARLPAWNRLGL